MSKLGFRISEPFKSVLLCKVLSHRTNASHAKNLRHIICEYSHSNVFKSVHAWLFFFVSNYFIFCMYLFVLVCTCIYLVLYVFIWFCMYLFVFYVFIWFCMYLFVFSSIYLNKTDNYEQIPIRVKFNKINEYLCIKMNKYREKPMKTYKTK
jgi:hypothetical protein